MSMIKANFVLLMTFVSALEPMNILLKSVKDEDTFGFRSSESTKCVELLQTYSNYFLVNSDSVIHVLRNSGHDYNDFGRYSDCINLHGMNYFLIAVLEKFPVPLAVGLCLPAICTLEEVQEFKPFFLNGIQGTLPNLFADVKGFNHRSVQLQPEDLRVIEPKAENELTSQYTNGSFLFMILLSMFLLAVTASTLIIWTSKSEEIHLESIN